jgi:hypothetical protein
MVHKRLWEKRSLHTPERSKASQKYFSKKIAAYFYAAKYG